MTKLEELQQKIAEMLTDKTSPEDAEKIGRLNNLVEEAKKEEADLISAHAELKGKYVSLIKETGFPPAKNSPEQPTPKSFEEILREELKKGEK